MVKSPNNNLVKEIYTQKELQTILKEERLPASGNKDLLTNRICGYYSDGETPKPKKVPKVQKTNKKPRKSPGRKKTITVTRKSPIKRGRKTTTKK